MLPVVLSVAVVIRNVLTKLWADVSRPLVFLLLVVASTVYYANYTYTNADRFAAEETDRLLPVEDRSSHEVLQLFSEKYCDNVPSKSVVSQCRPLCVIRLLLTWQCPSSISNIARSTWECGFYFSTKSF